ncbi:methyltransferase [Streptomyces sp. NPDC002537]
MLHTYCGALLPDVLLGRSDAVAMLFGESDRHWVENYYSTTNVVRHCNASAVALVREFVRHWPDGRPLRVLEVGAGTGGLTAALLDALPPGRTHYTFTDLSETFFPRARFAGHGHIVYRPLDLDRDPGSQGYVPGAYDLVVAGNVLHATARLRESLVRLAGLLDEGGHLLAVETHNLDRLLPCFGLLKSFWNADDPDLRPHSPLLTAGQWHELLTAHGFDETARLGARGADADYSMLIARRAPGPAGRPRAPRPGSARQAADGTSIADTAGQSAAPAPATSWIIATEGPGDPLAPALAAVLRSSGDGPVTVVQATTDPAQWTTHLGSDQVRPAVVLLLADLDGDTGDDGRQVLERAVTRTAVLRAVARTCALLPRTVDPLLWLIARPSGAVPAAGALLTPPDCVPWAVTRTLANEQPRPTVRRLACERGPSPGADARRLARELLAPTADDEIVLTATGRFVPRLRELPAPTAPAGRRPYRLRLRRPGLGFGLDWVPAPAPAAPGPGEVTIEVRAAGLNYRDVLLATASLPPGAEVPAPGEHSLGLECAGVVQVGHFDFARMATILPGLRTPRFAAVLPPEPHGEGTGAGQGRLRTEDGQGIGTAALADLLVTLIARITHRAPERIDRTHGLDALGLDSLMATELVVALQSELACEIPAMEVVNAGSVDELAGRIRMRLGTTAHP